MLQVRTALSTLIPILATASLFAQDKSTYYTVMHPGEFKINWLAFYEKAETLTAQARKALPHELNIAYGTDPKQRLDVYRPAGKPSSAPTFIFIHGGGFREGDRAQYGYVATPLAKHGVVTVVPSYRLTPQVHYPSQPEDIQHVLAWVFKNIARYGGDPRRIFVGGHSAGAILTTAVALDTDWTKAMGLPSDVVKGALPISGPYDLRNVKALENYVPDPATREAASPIFHVKNPPPATIVAVGSVEPYVDASKELADKIRARGRQADVLVLEGLPHDQTAAAMGDEQSPLVQGLLKMIQSRSAK